MLLMEGSVLDLKLFIVLQQEQFIECTDKCIELCCFLDFGRSADPKQNVSEM